MSVAIVPVKHLAAGKSRLFPDLDAEQRGALSLAMLGDVLEALAATPSLRSIAVTTPDAGVAAAAETAGARALLRPDPGLNDAIDAAARELVESPEEPTLIVLGDVAGAQSEDLEALFEALAAQAGRGVVLAPSRDGGTSALLRAPHDAIPSCFGPESAKAHREAAERAGVRCRELRLASLAIDLDRAEDVQSFLSAKSGGRKTRALLAELGWSAK